jgi:hypothetical protein
MSKAARQLAASAISQHAVTIQARSHSGGLRRYQRFDTCDLSTMSGRELKKLEPPSA